MSSYFRGIGTTALLMSAAWAQNPGDVSFRLTTKDGKSTFHVGEAVEVEFQIQSTAPGRYAVWPSRPVRQVRLPEYDHFSIEPSAGVTDSLADMFAQMSGGAIIGALPRPTPLAANPVKIGMQVNEWLSIRKPGHYRITAETTRVVTTALPAANVPLRSNGIEIDVIPATPDWSAEQLRQAVTVLEIADPPPPTMGQIVNVKAGDAHNEDAARAGRTLRFLETPEAALAMARFFGRGPQGAQGELHAGLFASPDRKQVIAAMEKQVAAPDVPITYYYLATLMELVDLTRYGPMPDYTPKTNEEIHRWVTEVETPYRERSRSTEPEYFGKLADAIGTKRGQALAISLATLMTSGPQPTPPAVAEALRINFASLPEDSQASMLTNGWSHMGSPSMEPVVHTLAKGTGSLRDSALVRLWELNPTAAREITLDRVRRVDVVTNQYRDYSVLLSLPEETLPEADQALVDALKQGTQQADMLIARYASNGVRSQLEAWVEQIPGRICQGGLPAYFFRVDPAWAAAMLAGARQGGTAGQINLSPNEYALMNPALERQALEDVENADPMIRRTALTLLERGGSPAAQQPLLEAFVRVQQASPPNPTDTLSMGIEQGFLNALLNGSGWVAFPETLKGVLAACTTDTCRKQATSFSRRLQPPIAVMLDPGGGLGYALMGTILIHTRTQFAKQAVRFPKGTQFTLAANGTAGSWYHDRLIQEATGILEAAGMEVGERPRLETK